MYLIYSVGVNSSVVMKPVSRVCMKVIATGGTTLLPMAMPEAYISVRKSGRVIPNMLILVRFLSTRGHDGIDALLDRNTPIQVTNIQREDDGARGKTIRKGIFKFS